MIRMLKTLLVAGSLALIASPVTAAEPLRIAAASDLKFCMDELLTGFRAAHSDANIEVVYGSSGNFRTQIQQGAPFDLYFSADIAYPRELVVANLALPPVRPYAVGRIVLWSSQLDASRMTLDDLKSAPVRRIAIAAPQHAPYGKRAEEALRSAGLWEQVQPKLVFGENVAQAAQFVQSGNAQVGIIALSLALSPELARQGGYFLIPESLHAPLEQGFVMTKRAAGNALAHAFVDYVSRPEARAVMARYGFVLPGATAGGTP